MKKLFLAVFLLFSIGQVSASLGDGYESAILKKAEIINGTMIWRCIYKETFSGYEFSFNSRDMCPFFVDFNLETNSYRKL